MRNAIFDIFLDVLQVEDLSEKKSKINFSISNIKSTFAHATQRTYFRFRVAIYSAYCA